MAKWYKGDTHMHTTNSDGVHKLYELLDHCKKLGLDWVIVTDHNYDTIRDGSYFSDGLTVIRGQEVTGRAGHVNVWGEKVPCDPPYQIDTTEQYAVLIRACREAGAVTSVNHPFCSQCGVRVDLNGLPVDCVEVWNAIQHSDNIENKRWWLEQLLSGRRLPAVGGSDFHRSYGPVDMLAMPTTVVYAESTRPADILKALREGRSVVTNRTNTSMLYLNVGDAGVGDSVPFTEGLTGKCTVTSLRRGHTLRIYNNARLVFEYRATGAKKEYTAAFRVREPGFLRAEIDYRYDPLTRRLVAKGEAALVKPHVHPLTPTPEETFWAFTNPIWID